MHLYVGTFTDGFLGGPPSPGLHVVHLDVPSLRWRVEQIVEGLYSPSFLCAHPILPLIYAVERQWSESDKESGALTTLAVDVIDGTLRTLSRRRTCGASTAHVNVAADGRFVSVANPLGPNIVLFPLSESGVPGEPSSVMSFEGRGARVRQSAPWPHSTYPDPSGRRLLACDLGLDQIHIFDIDDTHCTLSAAPQPHAQVSSGAGARHLVIHPNGRFVYVANELDSTLSIFFYDATRSSLEIVQTTSTCPPDFDGRNQPSELVFGVDGRFLYLANRGHDSVAIFAVDPITGRVRTQGYQPVDGSTPRHLHRSADGRTLFVVNQLSSAIRPYEIDVVSGRLQALDCCIEVPSPSCVISRG